MVRKERAASSDFPLESNAVTLAVAAPALRFPASVDKVKEMIRENAGTMSMDIVKNIAVKVAEEIIFSS